jgi:hypothetical protein
VLLSRSTAVFMLALIVLAFPRVGFTALAQETEAERDAKSQTFQDSPPPSCHVTLPPEGSFVSSSPIRATQVGIASNGMVSAYGTRKLSTLLPTDGIWRGAMPSKPGDFAYDNKLPWHGAFSYRDGNGPVRVTGKRLDGLAPSFTEIEPITGKHWFLGGMSIPVFGCWQITAHYMDQELTFVVWVTPLPQEDSSAGVLLPQTAIAPASNNAITIKQEPSRSVTQLRRVHVDGDVEAKLLRYRMTPEIPREAQVANVSDTIVLHAIIDRDGRTRELQYLSGPSQLAQAAIDAVKWWEYEVDVEDIEIDTTIEVEFSRADT